MNAFKDLNYSFISQQTPIYKGLKRGIPNNLSMIITGWPKKGPSREICRILAKIIQIKYHIAGIYNLGH